MLESIKSFIFNIIDKYLSFPDDPFDIWDSENDIIDE
jgi:hypothetical protein